MVAIVTGASLRQFMASVGLDPGCDPPADAKLHRFDIGKRNQRGWVINWPASWGYPALALFGDWREAAVRHKWTGEGGKPHRLCTNRFERMQKVRRETEVAGWRAAAAGAEARWAAASAAGTGHAYLRRKGIGPHNARLEGGNLLLPIFSTGKLLSRGSIQSLQTVTPGGRKLFSEGCTTGGGCCPLGASLETAALVLICEGWATGATLAQSMPGAAVLCAFSAHTLSDVATFARRARRDAELVVCADNDRRADGSRNTGLEDGKRAAKAAGCAIAWPDFADAEAGTDFNDLQALSGLRAVGAAIRKVLK